MKLGELCTIKKRLPDADFWLDEKTGQPTKEFREERIGVRVDKKDVLVPQYLFYVVQHLVNEGLFSEGKPSIRIMREISLVPR